jgi:hypothetical protein
VAEATAVLEAAADEEDDDVDSECMITHDIMTDPVTIWDGQTYEREALKQYFMNDSRSPFTREAAPRHAYRGTGRNREIIMTPNFAMRRALQKRAARLIRRRRRLTRNIV